MSATEGRSTATREDVGVGEGPVSCSDEEGMLRGVESFLRRPRAVVGTDRYWGDLAYGACYLDQAHFGHEFRAFTGPTPNRYVEVRRRFLREHPGHVLDSWPLPGD